MIAKVVAFALALSLSGCGWMAEAVAPSGRRPRHRHPRIGPAVECWHCGAMVAWPDEEAVEAWIVVKGKKP